MKSKKQIGIFSGSFNPIHMGHLMLANYIKEFAYLDEIWFVVTPHNPLKNIENILDDDTRLEMTALALADFDGLNVSDIEFSMPRPSYTINTLKKLRETYPDKEFTLIIGGDNWTGFHRWKDYTRILQEFNILIYPRLGNEIVIPAEYSKSVGMVKAPVIEISSTFIRKSIKEGKNMKAFVPEKVYDLIEEKKLYR